MRQASLCGNRNGKRHTNATRTTSWQSARISRLTTIASVYPRVLVFRPGFCRHGEVWFELCQGGECVQLGLVSEAVAGPGRRGRAAKGCTRGTHGQALSMTQDSAENFSSSELARSTKGTPCSRSRTAKRKTLSHHRCREHRSQGARFTSHRSRFKWFSTHQAASGPTAAVLSMAQPGSAPTPPPAAQSSTRNLHPTWLIAEASPCDSLHCAHHVRHSPVGELRRASP